MGFQIFYYPGNIGKLSGSTSGYPGNSEPVGGGGGGGQWGGLGAEPPRGTAKATTAAAAATRRQLSHLARPLDHHAQGPNIPFGVNPSLRYIYIYMYSYIYIYIP